MKFYNSPKNFQKSDDVSKFSAKNSVFVWKNFYPGNVVKCLNESLNLILLKSIYISSEILIIKIISWNWQVVCQKNKKWRHLTSRRRIFFKSSGNISFTNIMILWKFQVISIAQTEIMIEFRFLGIQRKPSEIRHLSFWTPP